MKEKMVTVMLPRGRKQEENFVIVSVNGRSWKIMRGVEVRVPECVAEVLERPHDGGGGTALRGRARFLRWRLWRM